MSDSPPIPQAPPAFIAREEFLLATAEGLQRWFELKVGRRIPPFRISVGYGRGKRGPRSTTEVKFRCDGTLNYSEDGLPAVYVDPQFISNTDIFHAVVHTMCHIATTQGSHEKGGAYAKMARAVGLEGLEDTQVSDELANYFHQMTDEIGQYAAIHSAVNPNERVKQRSMPKVFCRRCGFSFHASKTWVYHIKFTPGFFQHRCPPDTPGLEEEDRQPGEQPETEDADITPNPKEDNPDDNEQPGTGPDSGPDSDEGSGGGEGGGGSGGESEPDPGPVQPADTGTGGNDKEDRGSDGAPGEPRSGGDAPPLEGDEDRGGDRPDSGPDGQAEPEDGDAGEPDVPGGSDAPDAGSLGEVEPPVPDALGGLGDDDPGHRTCINCGQALETEDDALCQDCMEDEGSYSCEQCGKEMTRQEYEDGDGICANCELGGMLDPDEGEDDKPEAEPLPPLPPGEYQPGGDRLGDERRPDHGPDFETQLEEALDALDDDEPW